MGTLFPGLTLALLLGFAKKPGHTANLFLSAALAVMVLKTGDLTPFLLPALGPLLYFYVRQLTRPERRFSRKDVLHFLSLLVTFWMPAWLVLTSVIVYLYLSHRLIADFYYRLRPVLMDRPRFAFRRLDQALLLLGLLCLLWMLNDVFCFTVAFVLIGMAVEAMLKPGSAVQLTMPITDRSDAREKSRRLKEAVAANRLYEDAELTLTTLAVKLIMHPHDLSRIINNGLEKNFSDFINEFRVREIARKMQDPAYDRLTLLGIAYESGFNSKRTFNRVFKEITGKTPVEYKNMLRKEGPIDKLAPLSRIRPVILRSESPPDWAHEKLNRNYMFRNYLKIAFRNIVRHPLISFINLFGLTVGLTCCLLIVAYVINERSYDRSNKKADDIYRVTRIFYSAPNVESLHLSAIAPPFAPLLKSAFPDIKELTRFVNFGTTVFRYKEKFFNESNAFIADENFFDFFTTPVLKGDPRKALLDPYSVMLTPELAKKYFGDEDPMGKTMILDLLGDKHPYKVTGIFQPLPANSHLHPNFLISFNTLKDIPQVGEKDLATDFGENAFDTYLMFPPNYNVDRIRAQFPEFLDKYCGAIGAAANLKVHNTARLTLQKLTDIHLTSHLDDEIEENGNIDRVYIFSAIALFILLIACINYMNLSTARSALRAKEIGIRKVVGAQRKEIIAQFLSESVLLCWFSLLLALGLTGLTLPLIAKMSGLALTVNSLLSWQVLVPVLALPFVIGIISGIYPALFMSSFIPAKVLKGIFKVNTSNFSFRKALVVFQFSISIILIVATIVVYKQLQYIQDKDLGFSKDHVLTMGYDGSLNKQFYAFRDDLLKNHGIKQVGLSSRIPSGRLIDYQNGAVLEGSSLQPLTVNLKELTVDDGFIPTYGMLLLAGRNFSSNIKTDSNKWIVNETTVKTLGWKTPQNALNKQLKYGNVMGNVIGVVKDFHFESLHQAIVPMIFLFGRSPQGMSIKIDGRNVRSSVAAIRQTWQHYLPNTPFDFSFLDVKFDQLYRSEQQQGALFTIFSCIAIFIACLGLFGLSAFTITQRVKEIGVRKVLGASINQIVLELSKDFLKLVIFAALVAIPAAWYLMNKWLLDFASRISISWWILAAAAIIAFIIAFATISFQSIKAATANPVKSLRSE
jgi:putative ABC transport system permease protein